MRHHLLPKSLPVLVLQDLPISSSTKAHHRGAGHGVSCPQNPARLGTKPSSVPFLHSRVIFSQHKYIWTGSWALFSSLGRELCQQSKASSLSLPFLTVSVWI